MTIIKKMLPIRKMNAPFIFLIERFHQWLFNISFLPFKRLRRIVEIINKIITNSLTKPARRPLRPYSICLAAKGYFVPKRLLIIKGNEHHAFSFKILF